MLGLGLGLAAVPCCRRAPMAECPWLISSLSAAVVDRLAILSSSCLRSTSVRPGQALAPSLSARLSAGEVRLRVRVVAVSGSGLGLGLGLGFGLGSGLGSGLVLGSGLGLGLGLGAARRWPSAPG